MERDVVGSATEELSEGAALILNSQCGEEEIVLFLKVI